MKRFVFPLSIALVTISLAPLAQADYARDNPASECIFENGTDVFAIVMCLLDEEVPDLITWANYRVTDQTNLTTYVTAVVTQEAGDLSGALTVFVFLTTGETTELAGDAQRHVATFQVEMDAVRAAATTAAGNIANGQCDLVIGKDCLKGGHGQQTPADTCPQPNDVGIVDWATCAADRHSAWTANAAVNAGINAALGTAFAGLNLYSRTNGDVNEFTRAVDAGADDVTEEARSSAITLVGAGVYSALYECDLFIGSSGLCSITVQTIDVIDPQLGA